MELTQLFRLTGNTAIEKIPCDHVNGLTIIYWEDIEQVFPGVKHVKSGDTTIKIMRDSDENRILPHRISHHPGVILDVVVSTPNDNTTNSQSIDFTSTSTEDNNIAENLQSTHPSINTSCGDNAATILSKASTLPSSSTLLDIDRGSQVTLSFKQVTKLARKDSMESKIEQSLVNSLQSDVQLQVYSSSNAHDSLIQVVKDGIVQRPGAQLAVCLQELNHKMVENNELASRIIDLVSRNNDLTSKNNDLTSAIMDLVTKNNELASKNNTMASENNELMTRMVQLQETLDSKQDEMRNLQMQALDRLALLQNNVKALLTQTYELHEYPIPRLFIVLPEDTSSWNPMNLFASKFRLYFLCECGEHTQSSNSKIPHHIHLAKHEGYDIARPNEFFQRYGSYVLTILRMLKFGISAAGIAVPTVSLLIRDDSITKASSSLKTLIGSLQSGMDQAIGYIEKISPKDNDAGTRPSEQMENNEALEGADLRQLESFLRSNDETRVLGNLYRTVTSNGHVKWVCIDHYRENYHEKAAKAFRETLESLQGCSFDENIGRVQVTLQSRVQAEQFYQALELARSVHELEIYLLWDTTQSDFKRLRDTIPKTSVGVLKLHLGYADGPTSDILNRNQRYDHILGIMRHPSTQSFSIRGLQNLLKKSSLSSRHDDLSNLRHLDISLVQLGISSATYLIGKASNLSSLAIGDMVWNGGESDRAVLDVLANATTTRFEVQSIYLDQRDRLSNLSLNNLCSIASRSDVRDILIHMRGDEGRVRILESIRWKYLRRLEIFLEPRTFETSAMRAVVDGVEKVAGKIEMELFAFWSENPGRDLLQAFMASTLIRNLRLKVAMTLEQILTLLRSADLSRLHRIELWAQGFNSFKVDAILENLQHATNLSRLYLYSANITEEQKGRMTAKGVSLFR